jgi:hypothetical protein
MVTFLTEANAEGIIFKGSLIRQAPGQQKELRVYTLLLLTITRSINKSKAKIS